MSACGQLRYARRNRLCHFSVAKTHVFYHPQSARISSCLLESLRLSLCKGLLTSLKHLKLDGNNMPHLAMPPPLKTSSGNDQSNNWVKRWNRDKKREVRK